MYKFAKIFDINGADLLVRYEENDAHPTVSMYMLDDVGELCLRLGFEPNEEGSQKALDVVAQFTDEQAQIVAGMLKEQIDDMREKGCKERLYDKDQAKEA